MRVDRGRLNWGIFFLALGAVPLAYHQGLVSSSALGDAWRLWPLIIVGIGLTFVLSRTPAFFVGGTVVAICLGLVFGSAISIGPNVACGSDGHNPVNVTQSGMFDRDSVVNLDLQCGSASITTTSNSQWRVVANNNGGHAPQVTSAPGLLAVTSSKTQGWSLDRGKDDWQIGLPTGVPITLAAELDMGDAHFTLASANLSSARFDLNLGSLHVDLSGAQVGALNVSTNLGSAYVILDGSSNLTARLETNLGSLDVCVPGGLGVQVTASDSLSSSDLGGVGLTKNGSVWQTPGYDIAQHKANLTIDTSLGSVKLHPAGGCK
jgi:hypothetical protein